MKSVKPNDTRPCNSGNEYKFCCGHKDKLSHPNSEKKETENPDRLKLHTTEDEIRDILDGYIDGELGRHIYENAWNEFEFFEEYPVDRDTYYSYFKYWLHYSWIPELTSNKDEMTIAQLCLQNHPNSFTKYQKRFIKTVTAAPFSFFIIQGVIPNKGLFLKDIMLPREVELKECSGTQEVKEGNIIFCRTITLNGQSICIGLAPFVIPNRFFDALASYPNLMLQGSKSSVLSPEELKNCDMDFREYYFLMIKEASLPMRVSNLVKIPIIPNEIFYEIKCAPHEVFDALLPLCSAEHTSRWNEAEFDADGNLVGVVISWLRINDPNPDSLYDNTIANFIITPTELKVFANSDEDATNAMKEIQNRLNTKVSFKSYNSIHVSNEEQLKETKQSLSQRLMHMQKINQAFIKWLDNPLPVLCERTPREAAKSELGREQLKALFIHLEELNEFFTMQGDEHKIINIDFLKNELGLPQ